ncbi:MAG: DUF2207 domain-containing protein [Saprospiraceae bacterium]|nr:DUF2207 domain-containing protein [Saprospiraceae bacterium]
MGFCRHFLILVFALLTTYTKAEYFVINDYKVDIKVYGSQAMFEVTEVINVTFSEPRHGIYRNIPYKYRINGEDVNIDIYDVDVEGFAYKESKKGSQYVIRIGDKDEYVEGAQTYKITYKVKGAWIFLKDHSEFYWNILGNTWETEIQSIKYSVTLDESLPMTESDYSIYTGAEGEKGKDASISYYLNKFEGMSNRVFQPGEGITFAINLPLSYVRRPTEWEIFWKKYGLGSIGALFFSIMTGFFTPHGEDMEKIILL